jgi:hypothetical protein
MAYNVPSINQIFDDLESYKDFCAHAYVDGFAGFPFDEKDLYNESSWVWRAYQKRHYGPPKKREHSNKPFRKNDNRGKQFNKR